jgi:hypothetical protein
MPHILAARLPQWQKPYPCRELLALPRGIGYDLSTFTEIPERCEPIRLMPDYRALWEYHVA